MATRTSKASAPRDTDALTAADVPVTRAMLGSVRTEVLQRVDEVKAKIDGLQAQMNGMQAQMNGMQANMEARLARIEFLVEEQNARNKVVLDGITAVLHRQDRLEQRVDRVEETVRDLASARRSS